MEHLKVKTAIENVLKHMGVRFNAVVHKENEKSKHNRFSVESDEADLLIGSEGENLNALNYLVRRIVSKTVDPSVEELKFLIDVNGYHEKSEENVRMKAKIMSERARSFKVDIELDPMSSYERMLVHSFLDGEPDIKTESKGEGAQRRVVIKYVERVTG